MGARRNPPHPHPGPLLGAEKPKCHFSGSACAVTSVNKLQLTCPVILLEVTVPQSKGGQAASSHWSLGTLWGEGLSGVLSDSFSNSFPK